MKSKLSRKCPIRTNSFHPSWQKKCFTSVLGSAIANLNQDGCTYFHLDKPAIRRPMNVLFFLFIFFFNPRDIFLAWVQHNTHNPQLNKKTSTQWHFLAKTIFHFIFFIHSLIVSILIEFKNFPKNLIWNVIYFMMLETM